MYQQHTFVTKMEIHNVKQYHQYHDDVIMQDLVLITHFQYNYVIMLPLSKLDHMNDLKFVGDHLELHNVKMFHGMIMNHKNRLKLSIQLLMT